MTTSRTRSGNAGSLRLSLTARAVRAALLASAALALAPAAFAAPGTCVQTNPNEVTCSGDFTNDVLASVPLVNQVPNLTLILDDTVTVIPGTGINGLTAAWGGNVTVINDGDVTTNGADGFAVYGSTSATLNSYGDFVAEVLADGDNAIDVSAFGNVDATLGGSIAAYSDAAANVVTVTADSLLGGVSVVADASSDLSAYAFDGGATALHVSGFGNTYASLYGLVTADSTNGDASGVLQYALLGDADFYNDADIAVSGFDNATGALAVSGAGSATVENANAISASASGDAIVSARGLVVGAYDNAIVINSGDVFADATANAVAGQAIANALVVTAADIDLDNTGDLYAYAYANGNGSSAIGANLTAINSISAYNGGNIDAYGYGDLAFATGVNATALTGGITLVNEGGITATSDGRAVAVELYSNTTTDVSNFDTIGAYGDLYAIAIDSSAGLSADSIHNYGTITGALYTGAGDDYLYNGVGAEWNATGTSDFGAGDDYVFNDGTINLADSSISLGTYATAAGNLFLNSGVVNVAGDNDIDVGAGGGLSASAFLNAGLLDFQDGAADDTLAVYGDFGGTGSIDVDVEGNAGVSDEIYIDGNVLADADQTINVDLVDLSAPIADFIPIVIVSGTSVEGNFSLGDVSWDEDNSFVDLDFDLVADIDASNLTPDLFGLGITVTGLSDAGTVAAAVAPGVTSLMNSQVGTWRQRMGVIDSFHKGGVSLWARVFSDKGSFDPEHASDDFGAGGNFAWNQRNRGAEAGIDFAVTDEFSLGLLVAKSESELRLENTGNAQADLDADTWGLYGTWISPNGLYLDTSYRWTEFDIDLASMAGPMQGKGDAETFNVELGYAWTLSGGLKIEPQLQYTKTKVDNIDAFTTSNGMTFRSDGGESSRGRVGVAVYKAMGDADTGWQFTPYAALSAVREFEGEQFYAVNDTLVGRSSTEGTSALMELGFTAQHRNLAFYGGLNFQDGGAMQDFVGGQLGVRYTFGGASPAPAPVVVVAPVPVKTCADLDDDGDGVNNCDDKCMGSTAGQAIGPDGCPLPVVEPEPVMEPKPFRG